MKSEIAAKVLPYRKLGRTGLEVLPIGYGAWGVGKSMWGPTDDEQSLKALTRALELGCNFFDTAYVYGDGHSERLIAKAFEEFGKRALVATKAPPKNFSWPSRGLLKETFPADWLIACTERSLRNLKTDCVDIQQLHVWQDSWLKEPEWDKTLRAVEVLKKHGKIRFFGVSINSRDPKSALEIVRSGVVDTVQAVFNLFEQEPREELFPLCREKNVGIIARVPLDEGGLSGTLSEDSKFDEDDFRSNYFAGGLLKETVRRAKILENILVHERKASKNLPEGALRFCLGFPEVSVVIPGMRTIKHVESNIALAASRPLEKSLLEELHPHAWKRNL